MGKAYLLFPHFDYTILSIEGQKKMAIVPEVVDPKSPVESGREKARRILHIGDDISKLTADDLLQRIFELANEVQGEDPKNAITFKVAIDTYKDLYKEIQGRPPRRDDQESEAEEFLRHWGIIE